MTIVWVIAGGLMEIGLLAAAFIAGVCAEHYTSPGNRDDIYG